MVVGYAPILYDCMNIVTSIIITTYLPWKCYVGHSQPQVYFLSEKPSTFDLYYTYNINKSLCYGTYQDLGHVSHFRNMSLQGNSTLPTFKILQSHVNYSVAFLTILPCSKHCNTKLSLKQGFVYVVYVHKYFTYQCSAYSPALNECSNEFTHQLVGASV